MSGKNWQLAPHILKGFLMDNHWNVAKVSKIIGINEATIHKTMKNYGLKRPSGVKTNSHQAKKTHCPKGHPYDAENTYHSPRGARVCRKCQSEKQIAQYRAKKELKNVQSIRHASTRPPVPRVHASSSTDESLPIRCTGETGSLLPTGHELASPSQQGGGERGPGIPEDNSGSGTDGVTTS